MTVVYVRVLAPTDLSGVDDVSVSDFVAYWCDGTKAVHVNAGTWHQPLFPVKDGTQAHNKQVCLWHRVRLRAGLNVFIGLAALRCHPRSRALVCSQTAPSCCAISCRDVCTHACPSIFSPSLGATSVCPSQNRLHTRRAAQLAVEDRVSAEAFLCDVCCARVCAQHWRPQTSGGGWPCEWLRTKCWSPDDGVDHHTPTV
jgi:hypothetical protein